MALFSTFWQAGYEGADHINRLGERLSMNAATDHLRQAGNDYAALIPFSMRTVRETVGWRLVERQGRFDFSSLETRLNAARERGIQICWTFCHYGWPEDITLDSPEFVPRFARLCGALATYLAPFGGPAPVYSPINEISFTSWGVSVGFFQGLRMPYAHAAALCKRQLVRATLAGCDAIWAADPRARILQCDPLIHVVAADDDPQGTASAAQWHAAQFEAWDMLCGKLHPELGGAPRYLDIIGANYYHDNQWEVGSGRRLWWHLADGRRKPLHQMLIELQHRYQRPVLLAETSHIGSGRGAWINDITREMAQATLAGVRLLGICLYPIIDRPDWENGAAWHHSGLWDLDRQGPDPLARRLAPTYAAALRHAQQVLHDFQDHYCPINRPPGQESTMKTIIVFCHLRWDFVYQRPQQLLTRLAQFYRIQFIEEPVYDAGPARLERTDPAANITVYRPHTPVRAAGFHDDQIALLQPLLAELTDSDAAPIVWFYTPMALPLLASLNPGLVVYDCMDELAAFKHAPKQLLQRESALLACADLLFTGGPSLHRAKSGRHDNGHCFSSSVDAVHFAQALDRSNGHPLQNDIPHPRLGFYGVIDERLDLGLLAALADSHPQWQLVLVGPVVKIDIASLPVRPNIHILGQQPYQALPQFLAGWDLCLLPFALNESTRFISPTKVLEYMAAELPIVSTAITDVAQPYGHEVAIGHGIDGFIAACERALAMTPAEFGPIAGRMRAIVAATSWDITAAQMRELLESALAARTAQSAPGEARSAQALSGERPGPLPPVAALNRRKPGETPPAACLIIGAGPTGLSAAYHYGAGSVLLEQHDSVGGWCRSVQDRGFTFDYAGHIMFSNDPYVLQLYDMLLGDNIHWQNREAWIFSHNVYTRYPFQGALYGLPPAVIKECIVGAVAALYGRDNTAAADAGRAAPLQVVGEKVAPEDGANNGAVPAIIEDCCADGSGPGDICSTAAKAPLDNFEQFIYQIWGEGIARHFALPYNQKLWTIPLAEMETSWLGGRVPLPDLEQIIEGALEPVAKPMGPNARFGYPLRGGFQALMTGFLPHLSGRVETGASVVKLLLAEHIAVLGDGRRYRYEHLISTMPLPELIKIIGDDAPAAVQTAARNLRHISVRCVNLGIDRPGLTDKHWIYYPGDTLFHRIYVQGNASPGCNPPGGFGLTCEITYSPYKPLPLDGQALIDRCIADCQRVGLFTAQDHVLAANQIDMPYAYVVYDHGRAQNVALIRDWLAQHDIALSGRYSEWEYYNSDHAFIAGKNAAQAVKTHQLKLHTGH
ncbi:NAD(P)-binding protein [Sodalis sp. RH21]|uniref:NAD(P)-binding protein n=1 Tax=unclassified Sodalis (in: enterobacteria) TaxID=2636512 RepID=UPI0039B59C30